MTETSQQDSREDHAFDALLVAALRCHDDRVVEPARLPPLTEDERAIVASVLGPPGHRIRSEAWEDKAHAGR
jgi:hypothetical protein